MATSSNFVTIGDHRLEWSPIIVAPTELRDVHSLEVFARVACKDEKGKYFRDDQGKLQYKAELQSDGIWLEVGREDYLASAKWLAERELAKRWGGNIHYRTKR